MNELDDLVDMAHTIFLRMAVRGGFDSYTGARLHEWLRRYSELPLREAAQHGVQSDGATLPAENVEAINDLAGLIVDLHKSPRR